MLQFQSFSEARKTPFELIENVSRQIFNSLTEVDPTEQAGAPRTARPISILRGIAGTGQPESSPPRKQKRILSRTVTQIDDSGETPAETYPPRPAPPVEAGRPEGAVRCYSDADTTAAIRKVMMAQRLEINRRNLPELVSCEEFCFGRAENRETPDDPVESSDLRPVARPDVKRRTTGTGYLGTPKAVALVTAILVFQLSLVGLVASGATGFLAH